MPNETLIATIACISIALIIIWFVVLIVLYIRDDDPPKGNVILIGIVVLGLWPLSLISLVGYGIEKELYWLYDKRKVPIRKVRARYWEYRAKKEEDIAPKRTSRKIPELPQDIT